VLPAAAAASVEGGERLEDTGLEGLEEELIAAVCDTSHAAGGELLAQDCLQRLELYRRGPLAGELGEC
jgi:hypothetical protein